MDDIRVPIYLVTGFLESGKTTFLDFTLQQDYFAIDGKTLLILCEEGEEEYDMDKLKLANTVVEVIEDEEDLTPQRLAAMDIIHQPERVVIEYNGMWLVSKFEQMELPEMMQTDNKNEEILKLYRQGKNVLEISRELGLGQGEVKLVIGLYGPA